MTDLERQIIDLPQGAHLCLFYERDPAEQMPALVPFIQQGLQQDEQFIYVADDQTTEELMARLAAGGVNVGEEVKRGRLKLWGREEWRQPGALCSEAKTAQVRQLLEEARATGFKGSRFAVEMTWTLGPDIAAPALEHWEATLNTIFVPGTAGRIVCQYNRSRLAPEAMVAALHTHPLAILGDEVHPNVFYRAPLILSGNGNGQGTAAASAQVEWMIGHLKSVRDCEKQQLELREKKAALAEAERARAKIESAEEELRRRNEELAAFFETAAIGLHWVGSDGIIQWVNAGELEMLGYTREEYVGHHIADFHEEQSVIDDILARLTRGERLHDYEARLKCKDGSIKDVLIDSSVLWREGEFLHTQCFTRDFTEHKRTVAELRRAEQSCRQTAAMVASSSDAIFSTSLDGTITSWNDAAERIYGYRRDEILGRSVLLLIPEFQRIKEPAVLERIGSGERIAHYETIRQRKGGELFDVSITVSPICDEGGHVIGASKIVRDITDKKETEELLQQQHQALMEMDARKNEFLAMLGHELRNPLAAIQNAGELLGEETELSTMRWASNVVRRQVRLLSRLVDDLLDVSRITRGRIELRRDNLDVVPIIRRATETVRPLLEERRHSLKLRVPEETLLVSADSTRIEQLIVNLLTNAAKYTDPGGEIQVRAGRADGQVTVAVQDNGIGIAPALLQNVFELFVQDERGLERSRGGLGIGLALARRLAELHGGSLTGESGGPGCGSTFTLRLPALTKPQAPLHPAHARTDSAMMAPRRILIVDDNQDSALGLRRLLVRRGHETQVAHDGLAALAVAQEFSPNVFLLDLGLPGIDGYQLAEDLRRDGFRDALFVAISGYAQPEDRERSRRAGFHHHLSKPVDVNGILEVLGSPVPSKSRV